MSSTKRKLLLIGWDAADWQVINPMLDRGQMPNLARLIEGGVCGPIATLKPVFSPILWTSIATGKRAYKHGILGFTEPTSDESGISPISNRDRSTKAVWNILNQEGYRCCVVGWWPSHPAEPINGVMVSNHYHQATAPYGQPWPLLRGAVHPPERRAELAELRLHPQEITGEHLRLFLPHGDEIDQTADERVMACVKILAECTSVHACATHLMEVEEWDAFFVYYDAIDHFSHSFMAYHPPRQPHVSERDFRHYREVIGAAYIYHDLMLGRLLELAGEGVTTILLSDHGFHSDELRLIAPPAEPAGPAREHRDVGVLVMHGPGIKADELCHGASLLDIAPTILHLFGLPVGADMDGRLLSDALEDGSPPEVIPSWDDVPGDSGEHPPGEAVSEEESRTLLEQLIALGYVDPPTGGDAVQRAKHELQYNLAMSYMDVDRRADAAPILANLYREQPLQFRFAVDLALCLQALGWMDQLKVLVADLMTRWERVVEPATARYLETVEALERRYLDPLEPTDDNPSAEEREELLRTRLSELLTHLTRTDRFVLRQLNLLRRGPSYMAHFLAGSVAVAEGDQETALRHFARAEELPLARHGLRLELGAAYLALGRVVPAEEAYRRVLEADADNTSALVGMARVSLLKEEAAQAAEYARTAVGLKYHLPAGHYYLGCALIGCGRDADAADALERALAQNPTIAEAHLRLAEIARRASDVAREEMHLEKAKGLEEARAAPHVQLPDMGTADDIDYEAELPSIPGTSKEKLPWIGLAPRPGEGRSSEPSRDALVVVSGLPRSGTSMMMSMLAAGGLELVTDAVREADESNPRGYFEDERVKSLATRNDWLMELGPGKAIKVVVPQIQQIPVDLDARVILMQRDVEEIVASQTRMLERDGITGMGAARLTTALQGHLRATLRALEAHRVPFITISYARAMEDPLAIARRVAGFLARDMPLEVMASAVDPRLHRERRQDDNM